MKKIILFLLLFFSFFGIIKAYNNGTEGKLFNGTAFDNYNGVNWSLPFIGTGRLLDGGYFYANSYLYTYTGTNISLIHPNNLTPYIINYLTLSQKLQFINVGKYSIFYKVSLDIGASSICSYRTNYELIVVFDNTKKTYYTYYNSGGSGCNQNFNNYGFYLINGHIIFKGPLSIKVFNYENGLFGENAGIYDLGNVLKLNGAFLYNFNLSNNFFVDLKDSGVFRNSNNSDVVYFIKDLKIHKYNNVYNKLIVDGNDVSTSSYDSVFIDLPNLEYGFTYDNIYSIIKDNSGNYYFNLFGNNRTKVLSYSYNFNNPDEGFKSYGNKLFYLYNPYFGHGFVLDDFEQKLYLVNGFGNVFFISSEATTGTGFSNYYFKSDGFYLSSSVYQTFGNSGGGGNSGSGTYINENGQNCYKQKEKKYITDTVYTFYTKNINDYTKDVSNNYGISYIENSTNNETFLVYNNYNFIKYYDVNNNEVSPENTDFLFNTGSYLKFKTSFSSESYIDFLSNNEFNVINILCKNCTSDDYYEIYIDNELFKLQSPQYFGISKIPFNTKIGLSRNVNGLKIILKGIWENYEINGIEFEKMNIEDIETEICYNPNTDTFTKNGENYTPTEQEKNIIKENINITPLGGTEILKKIFGDDFTIFNKILDFLNIKLNDEPNLSFSFPIPFINNNFKITTISKDIQLQKIEDNLNVVNIEKNDLGKKFITFILSLIYIVYRFILIFGFFFIFYLLFFILDKLITLIFGNNLNVGTTNSNGIGLASFIVLITYLVGGFLSLYTILNPLIDLVSYIGNFGEIFFSFLVYNFGDYEFSKSIVNTFFNLILGAFFFTLIYKLRVKFARLN